MEVTTDQVDVQGLLRQFAKFTEKENKKSWPVNPRTVWQGKRWPLSIIDAYSEFIMNVFDISTATGGRPIKMFLNVKESPKDNVVSINIRDDGPGFPTGKDTFMDTFLELHGEQKDIDDLSQIGEAGIGAKIAATKLGGKLHFSWSQGHGEPMCHWVVDEEKWKTFEDYEYYEENYNGPSFFNIKIEKLRNSKAHQVSPSKLRGALEEKFSTLLQRHPNVEIYTCSYDQKNPTNKLKPVPARKYVENLFYEGNIHLGGIATSISVGLLDTSEGDQGVTNATIRLSRSGVVHFERMENNALRHLILQKDGNSLTYQNQTYFRNTYITVDSPSFVSTPIKNDLLWDNETNIRIFQAIGKDPAFAKMLTSIRNYNSLQDKNKTSDKRISSSYQKRMDKLIRIVANDVTDIATSLGINNLGSTKVSTSKSAGGEIQKRVARKTKKSPINIDKNKSTVTANGKKFSFDIVWIEDKEAKHQRSRFDIDSNSITLKVNTAYEGYVEEFDKDEKKESVYLADTIGNCIQDYRFEAKVNRDGPLFADDVRKIQIERDTTIAKYMKVMVSKN